MEWMPQRTICECPCHRESRVLPYRGVSTENHIEAVPACERCVNHHCPAILAVDPVEPTIREMAVWVDPPLSDATGEGTE